jgi:hypothetical protein
LIVEYVAIQRTIAASKEAKRESDEEIAKLEKSAAEANQKAAESELKLEQIRRQLGPRDLSGSRGAYLESLIRGKPKWPVEILYVKECIDGFSVASDIRNCLVIAEWEFLGMEPLPTTPRAFAGDHAGVWSKIYGAQAPMAAWTRGATSGVIIVAKVSPDIADSDDPYMVLFSALSRAMETGVSGSHDETMLEGRLRIVVGPKA